jgi:hypothetical protein
MGQWLEQLFGNNAGVISIGVVFGTIAIAAFLVTMFVVKSSDQK